MWSSFEERVLQQPNRQHALLCVETQVEAMPSQPNIPGDPSDGANPASAVRTRTTKPNAGVARRASAATQLTFDDSGSGQSSRGFPCSAGSLRLWNWCSIAYVFLDKLCARTV